MARIQKRSLGFVPYSGEGRVDFLELPRNHVFKSLYLELTGNLNVAGGTTDGANATESPLNAIQEVRILRNGSELLQGESGPTLWQVAQFNTGALPFRSQPAVTAGSNPFSATIPIHFSAWGMARPGMSHLRSVGTSSLVIQVIWGTGENLIVGGDRVETLTGLTLEVFGEELPDIVVDTADKLFQPTISQIVATTARHIVQLPIGNFIRRVLLKTTDAGVLSNAVINRIQVQSDGIFNHFDRVSWLALQRQNKHQYNFPTVISGYAMIDFAEDGSPAGMIDTRGASSFELILDVTVGGGATVVRATPEIYTPARQPA